MNAPDNSALTHIGQIAINAHDVDRATAFYRDVLGLPHLFRAGQLSFFNCGGVRLMLDRAENPETDHPSSILYFGSRTSGPPSCVLSPLAQNLWMNHMSSPACPSTIPG